MARSGSFALSSALAVVLAATAGFQTLHGQPSGQTTLTGSLTVVWGDPIPGATTDPLVRAVLTERAGQEHELTFAPGVLEAAGGLRALDRREVTLTARAPLDRPETSTSTPLVVTGVALADAADAIQDDDRPITGPQPWVTILCRFADSTGVTPHAVSYYQGLMGGATPGLDHYWREVSYDLINLTGSSVVGWYNLPQPRSAYFTVQNGQPVANLNLLSQDCTRAADAAVSFPAFIGVNLVFNQELDCCAWGGGRTLTLDGQTRSYRMTWLPPWGQTSFVFAHEMGHGFGFPHSSGPYAATYDSNWDPMSNGGSNSVPSAFGPTPVHTITHHKDLALWIPPSAKFTATVGTHTINLERLALPTAAGTYLMAKIPVQGSATDFYTVEVRRLIGYDLGIPNNAIVIHHVLTTRSDRDAQVVDADGNGNPNDAGAMWTPGETFVDAANLISVEVNSPSGTGFTATITLGSHLQPRMAIGAPTAGAAIAQPFYMSGWAIDQSAPSGSGVDTVHVWAFPSGGGSPVFVGAANYGAARPDVASLFGSGFANSGWSLPIRGLVPGTYTLQAYAHSTVTGTFNQNQGVPGVVVQANPQLVIDAPAPSSTVIQPFNLGGWALDFASATGTGVDAVHVWGFPNPGSGAPPIFFGAATYGTPRTDVGALFGASFTNSGYNLTVSGIPPGAYQINVYARSTVTGTFSIVRTVQATLAEPALMALDGPAPGSSVSQPFNISGWAMDRSAPTGTGVDTLHVWAYRNPGSGTPPVFLGTAAYGAARGDVGAIFGSRFTPSGYTLQVSGLAPGKYLLVVYARSTATGTFNNFRMVSVTVN